jgi:hypothetical protein
VLDTTRELRCFVNGQYVGSQFCRTARLAWPPMRLTSGLTRPNFAAAPRLLSVLPPKPSLDRNGDRQPQPASGICDHAGPGFVCERQPSTCANTGSEWRTVSNAMSLSQCVQALYSKLCPAPGDAHGRSGDVTASCRRVEQSNDNNRFRVLAEQTATTASEPVTMRSPDCRPGRSSRRTFAACTAR